MNVYKGRNYCSNFTKLISKFVVIGLHMLSLTIKYPIVIIPFLIRQVSKWRPDDRDQRRGQHPMKGDKPGEDRSIDFLWEVLLPATTRLVVIIKDPGERRIERLSGTVAEIPTEQVPQEASNLPGKAELSMHR